MYVLVTVTLKLIVVSVSTSFPGSFNNLTKYLYVINYSLAIFYLTETVAATRDLLLFCV